MEGAGCAETSSYVAKKLDGVLKGAEVNSAAPPAIDLHCDHISEVIIFCICHPLITYWDTVIVEAIDKV